MESETAAAFSSLGTSMESARLVLTPGYDRFAPALPSASSIPSNQMLISHSNHLGFQRKCSIPIHRDQFGREMDDLRSGQHRNIQIPNNSMYFSSHPSGLEAKTAVPTKRAGPTCMEKCHPHQDSIHSSSSPSGGNGETVSHSQSNSPSDKTEDQQAIDERKQRRMLSNRESARRSRLRKQQHLDELRAQVAHLRAENGQILNKFNAASEQYVRITDENSILRSQAINLNHQLQRLHHAINAQSHGTPITLGIDTGHCTAARLTLGSGTIIPSVSPSNLLH